MYRLIVFLHVLSTLLFMASHGVSISVMFRIRNVSTIEEARPLLTLSAMSLGGVYAGVMLIIFTGVFAGFGGSWWSSGWSWVSAVIFAAIVVSMIPLGARPFSRIRAAAGIPYRGSPPGNGREWQPAMAPDLAAFQAAVRAVQPGLLAAIGFGGFAVIVWLMMYKPF